MFGETLEFMDRFGSKSILHRHIQHPDTPSVLEVLVRDSTVRIRVPRGFVCETCEDLLLAYRTIGSSTVVIKPVKYVWLPFPRNCFSVLSLATIAMSLCICSVL